MQENVTVWKRICLMVGGIWLVTLIFAVGIHIEGKKEVQQQKEKIEVLEIKTKEIDKRYKQLYAQKNNTENNPLVHAVTAVF